MALRIMWNGRSAMNAEQQKLDSISNNIANINTNGYKREDVSFQDLVYESVKRTGYPTNDNQNTILNGTGVKAGRWIRDNGQGDLIRTNSNTDFAIDGEGSYFRVTLQDGTKGYERAGSFNIDKSGTLADKNGNKLDIDISEEGRNLIDSGVLLNEKNFSVREDGEIYINNDGNNVYYGKMNLYTPIGEEALRSVGENIYVLNQGGQMNASNATIVQGALEHSNVDIGKEFTEMIVAQRAFEMGSRALKTGDEMWGMINSLKGR